MFSLFNRKKKFFSPEEETAYCNCYSAMRNAAPAAKCGCMWKAAAVIWMRSTGPLRFLLKWACSTEERNGVLVYVAVKDHQLAVFGDVGIHRKVGNEFWNKEVMKCSGILTETIMHMVLPVAWKISAGPCRSISPIQTRIKTNFPMKFFLGDKH